MENPGMLKVLIVEDDEDARENLRDLLSLDAMDVEIACTIAEVVRRKDLKATDLVLLDWRLADGCGAQVMAHLKQAAPQADVVVITGYADVETAVAALRQGAADFLTKPLCPEVLHATLQHLAALKDSRKRVAELEGLAALGQAISVVSHECRNELYSLRLGLSMLADLVADDPRASEMIEIMQQSEKNLLRLFDDVRTTAGPLILERRRCSLRQIWRNVWNHALERNSLRAELLETCDTVDLMLSADQLRLTQLFRNLFENSLAACRDRARIEIHCTDVELAGAPAIELLVRDNGPGLSPEQRQRIFEPFYTTKSGGTGLGMAIVRRIVEAHQGRIAIAKDGPGAGFVLTLPRGQERSSSTDTETAVEERVAALTA